MKRYGLFFSAMLLGLLLLLVACGGEEATDSANTSTGESAVDTSKDSADYEDVEIRLAYNLPQDHHVAIGVEKFAENVTEKSGGKVNIQVYPAGQLLSDTEMNDSLLSGGVEIGVNSSRS